MNRRKRRELKRRILRKYRGRWCGRQTREFPRTHHDDQVDATAVVNTAKFVGGFRVKVKTFTRGTVWGRGWRRIQMNRRNRRAYRNAMITENFFRAALFSPIGRPAANLNWSTWIVDAGWNIRAQAWVERKLGRKRTDEGAVVPIGFVSLLQKAIDHGRKDTGPDRPAGSSRANAGNDPKGLCPGAAGEDRGGDDLRPGGRRPGDVDDDGVGDPSGPT